MRKIIQIALTSDTCYVQPYALCDDGTVWVFQHPENEGWQKLPPIPQDEPVKTADAIDLEGGL